MENHESKDTGNYFGWKVDSEYIISLQKIRGVEGEEMELLSYYYNDIYINSPWLEWLWFY